MKSIVIVASVALVAIGCHHAEATSKSNDLHPADPTKSPIQVPAENTKKNQSTPGDQAESDADVGITQRLRQGIVKDDSMSTSAKNVKIITVGGVVTLRGSVDSEREKTAIGMLAMRTAGVKLVDDQMEVTAK